MTGERRSDAEIRNEIAAEREQLSGAVSDLRQAIDGKRRPAALIGGAVAAGLAATAALKIVRRLFG
ncbi:MAG: hypothetical protein OEW65_08715 [Thermoleophilia bacterium]|nr:hypothetical protein [Thermoleophilia bacterium]